MNIANVQGTDKQGSLLVPTKITDDTKTNESQPINKVSMSDAVIVSQGEKDANAGIYTQLLENSDEKTKEIQTEEDASLEDASNKMTKEDYQDLKEEGISFESYEAGRLDRAILRIKENREFREENVTSQVENKEEMENTIKKIAIGNKISDPMAKKLAQKLVDANMPVTLDNIESLMSAMNMIGTVSELSEGAKAYMIDNELAPTVENIYHSQYSGSMAIATNRYGMTTSEGNFEAIEDQVKGIIEKAGIEITSESMNQAKWLYENKLPITKDSLNALQSLDHVKNTANEDTILSKMADAMSKGLKPEEANLDQTDENTVEQAIKDFDRLFDTLKDSTDIASITAKRQLEEIRLKLTTEAGLKLLSKGISLDTTDLQSIVDGLKQIEQDYYKGLFTGASKSSTQEDVTLLQTTTETVNALKEAPNYVLGATLKQREIQTVGSLGEAATSMKVQLDKAGETYEALMTKPRSDMGDSMKKAFQNVPDILKDLGLEDNTANERAVRILSYNKMEINEESINAVKSYDSNVSNLLKELKPAVTIELIKRDINPLNVNLEELTKEVASIRNEIGATDEEKYSEYLYKLEQNNAITAEERSSYIGIYRLLNNVEKTDGAAIGAVLNNGLDLTLKNLLSAVRSKKASGMNVAIDDSFGTLTSLSFSRERISDQIEASFGGNSKSFKDTKSNDSNQANAFGNETTVGQQETNQQMQVHYYQEVVARIMEAISPEKLNTMLQNGVNGLMDMTLEKLEDNLEQAIEDNQTDMKYASFMTQKLQEIAKTSQEAVNFLEGYQIEPTIKNIVSVNTFYTNGKSFFKDFHKNADNEYSEMISEISDAIEDADTLQMKYDQVEAKVKELIGEEYKKQVEDESSAKVDELRIFANGIELAKRLSRQERYQIPIMTGNQVTTMNLTLLKGTSDSGKITVSMDSEEYGRLEGEFTVKEDTIKGFILCDSKDGLESMKAAKNQMSEGFVGLGLEVKQLTFGYDKKAVENAKVQGAQKEETSTKLLYQVAKVAVKAIGDAMQTER